MKDMTLPASPWMDEEHLLLLHVRRQLSERERVPPNEDWELVSTGGRALP